MSTLLWTQSLWPEGMTPLKKAEPTTFSCSNKGSGSLEIWHIPDPTTTTRYREIIKSPIESQITGVSIIFSTFRSGTVQRKLRSSASLAFVRGTHRWHANSPHKGPVTRKIFPVCWRHHEQQNIGDKIVSFDQPFLYKKLWFYCKGILFITRDVIGE